MSNIATMTSTTAELTMSSREIAEVVEARHDNVKITIDRLADRGLVTFTAMQEPTPGGGKPTTVYYVNQRDSYVVVAQLSPEFTARLVDRWQELEKQVAQPQIPQTLPEALRLAADTQERLEMSAGSCQRCLTGHRVDLAQKSPGDGLRSRCDAS